MRSTHQMRLQFRQTPLGIGGMARHQSLADHETEDCIAQKLQLLVVRTGFFRVSFRTAGFMRQRAFQEFPVYETMAKNSFEYVQVAAHVRSWKARLRVLPEASLQCRPF